MEGEMISIIGGEWIADLGTMTCKHIVNKMVVSFELNGRALEGKIKDMPMELMYRWARTIHGELRIRNAVKDAEEVFLRAYYESEIEKNGIV